MIQFEVNSAGAAACSSHLARGASIACLYAAYLVSDSRREIATAEYMKWYGKGWLLHACDRLGLGKRVIVLYTQENAAKRNSSETDKHPKQSARTAVRHVIAYPHFLYSAAAIAKPSAAIRTQHLHHAPSQLDSTDLSKRIHSWEEIRNSGRAAWRWRDIESCLLCAVPLWQPPARHDTQATMQSCAGRSQQAPA